jgi:phosphoglycerate dehydrogenase-like enzyme
MLLSATVGLGDGKLERDMSMDDLTILMGAPPGVWNIASPEHIATLDSAHPRVRVERTDDQERFAALLPEADAVFVFGGPFISLLPPALQPGGRLRWIHSITAGVERLLTHEVRAATHITLTSSKGPMGPLMAEHIVLMMLALARDLPGFLQDQAKRSWRFLADERPMRDLFGRTIAVLGTGAVGSNLTRMCKIGFQMRVLGMSRTRRDDPHVDRYYDRAQLHEMLAEADFVALTLALTSETERIIDAEALAAMNPGSYFINVSRGGLVDQDALIAALQAGKIAGAGLDSTTPEPLPEDSPLWDLPNVIITPHVSPGRDKIGEQLVAFWRENMRRFAEGAPLLGIVDRDAAY